MLLTIGSIAVVRTAQSDDEISDKQAVLDRVAATHDAAVQEALEHPELLPSKEPGRVVPTWTPRAWEPAIIENGNPPVSGESFQLGNEWQGDIEGRHVQVFAGTSWVDGVGRGSILVMVKSMDHRVQTDLGGWYGAPIGTGPLRIASFDGTLLTVHADTGETFYFDAETRDFTEENGDPVPTDSPRPSITPYPTGTLPFPLPFDTDTPTPVPGTASAVPAPTGIAD
jgi:hypothetical protein